MKYEPKEVSDRDMIFATTVVGYLPEREDIPDEFQRFMGTKWNDIFAGWFYDGLPQNVVFHAKEGIDTQKAIRHIRHCMQSFAPSHNHKEAGCAYLMSLWFDDIEGWKYE